MKKITISILTLFACFLFNETTAQQKKIAFIGQASAYDVLITDNDNHEYQDDRAAAVWFIDDFLPAHSDIDGEYFSFEDVAGGADLTDFDVLWIQADAATWTDRLFEWPRGTVEGNGDKHCVLGENGFVWNGQCTVLEDDFMWEIKQFYQAGGNILLGNYAGMALEVIGVFEGLTDPWEFRPNQLFGDTSANPDDTAGAWGTNWGGNENSPYINGITTSVAICDFASSSIEFLTEDTEKKNRTCQYNLDWGRIYNDAGGENSTIADRRLEFETTLNAEILLENCSGNEIQGAQFNPQTEGNGTVVWYGAGVYDWYAPGTGNNNNVKLLTENTLLHLAQSTLSVNNPVADTKVRVYPNPVSDILYFNSDNSMIEKVVLFDISGRTILEQNEVNSISISHLQKGNYILKLSTDKGIQTEKIIIK